MPAIWTFLCTLAISECDIVQLLTVEVLGNVIEEFSLLSTTLAMGFQIKSKLFPHLNLKARKIVPKDKARSNAKNTKQESLKSVHRSTQFHKVPSLRISKHSEFQIESCLFKDYHIYLLRIHFSSLSNQHVFEWDVGYCNPRSSNCYHILSSSYFQLVSRLVNL